MNLFTFFVTSTVDIEHTIQNFKPYGPDYTNDNFTKFSFKLNPSNLDLIAPFDCEVTVLDPGPPYKIAIKPRKPIYEQIFTYLKENHYLPEIPELIVFDDINYVATTRTFITSHSEQFPEEIKQQIINQDETTINQVLENINNGFRSITFNLGEKIGSGIADNFIALQILTSTFVSKRLSPDNFSLPERNEIDPLVFWSGLVQYHDNIEGIFSDNTIVQKIKTWLQSHKRLLVEVRDEYNYPLKLNGFYDGKFKIKDSPLTAKYTNNDLIQGLCLFNNTTSIIVDGLENEKILMNNSSHNNIQNIQLGTNAIIDLSSIPTQNLPYHLILWFMKPSRWFSPQQALPTSGFNTPSYYTIGNTVEFFIEGPDYFQDLYNEIMKINSSDHYFHLLGWSLDPKDVNLVKNTINTNLMWAFSRINTSVYEQIKPRFITYYHPWWDLLHPESGLLNLTSLLNSMNAEYVRDGKKLPTSPIGSLSYTEGDHHMKIVSINNSDGQIAYCGGIDIWANRLTDSFHLDSSSINNLMPTNLHDVQLKVKGPAAADLERVFRNRWIDHPDSSPKNISDPGIPSNVLTGNVVQVACTVPNISGPNEYKFARYGDTTIFETVKKAIQNARQYIYIEDQYFANKEIAKLIHDQLEKLDFVVIVGPGPFGLNQFVDGFHNMIHTDIWNEIKNYLILKGHLTKHLITEHMVEPLLWSIFHSRSDISFSEFRRIIKQSSHANRKFRACYLENNNGEYIFPHSKIIIIDDLFVSCGSANLDARGMGHITLSDNNETEKAASTECNMMCIDTCLTENGKRKFARDLRIRLWSEHLGHPIFQKNSKKFPYSFLKEPTEAYETFWKNPLSNTRIRRYA